MTTVSTAGEARDVPIPDQASVRTTQYGEVIGFIGPSGSDVWLGIPYASPPVGELRWRAPRPPRPWGTPRQMLTPGAACSQLSLDGDSVRGSEDCLYLNIWSPRLSPSQVVSEETRLPVMFWIHGGGNVMGEGVTYDGGTLATTQNVVVVTVNYRLGVFGWFTHPTLHRADTTAEDRSGNYGTLDLIAALEWVRDNIAAFGGDTNNITIFGESAGGCNVFSLLVSPKAAGLFQRAIIQSGCVDTTTIARSEHLVDDSDPGTARSSGELFLRLLINDNLAKDRQSAIDHLKAVSQRDAAAYLRSKPFAEFIRAAGDVPDSDVQLPFAMGIPQLFRDGVVLPSEGISAAFSRGQYNKVPLIVGSTKDEFTILLAMFGGPDFLQPMSATLPFKISDKPRYYLAAEYASRFWKANNVDEPAGVLYQHQAGSVFAYRFDWGELAPASWWDGIELGATHGLDVPFVFGHLNLGPEFVQIPLIVQKSLPSYQALSAAMMSYWAQFAASGDPGKGRRGELPRWHPWGSGNQMPNTSMLLDSAPNGGLRMSSIVVTKASIITELKNDWRLGSGSDRCRFFRDLLMMRGSGVNVPDYNYFRDGLSDEFASGN